MTYVQWWYPYDESDAIPNAESDDIVGKYIDYHEDIHEEILLQDARHLKESIERNAVAMMRGNDMADVDARKADVVRLHDALRGRRRIVQLFKTFVDDGMQDHRDLIQNTRKPFEFRVFSFSLGDMISYHACPMQTIPNFDSKAQWGPYELKVPPKELPFSANALPGTTFALGVVFFPQIGACRHVLNVADRTQLRYGEIAADGRVMYWDIRKLERRGDTFWRNLLDDELSKQIVVELAEYSTRYALPGDVLLMNNAKDVAFCFGPSTLSNSAEEIVLRDPGILVGRVQIFEDNFILDRDMHRPWSFVHNLLSDKRRAMPRIDTLHRYWQVMANRPPQKLKIAFGAANERVVMEVDVRSERNDNSTSNSVIVPASGNEIDGQQTRHHNSDDVNHAKSSNTEDRQHDDNINDEDEEGGGRDDMDDIDWERVYSVSDYVCEHSQLTLVIYYSLSSMPNETMFATMDLLSHPGTKINARRIHIRYGHIIQVLQNQMLDTDIFANDAQANSNISLVSIGTRETMPLTKDFSLYFKRHMVQHRQHMKWTLEPEFHNSESLLPYVQVEDMSRCVYAIQLTITDE